MVILDSLQNSINNRLRPGYTSEARLLKLGDLWYVLVFIVFASEARLYSTTSYVSAQQAIDDIHYLEKNFVLEHEFIIDNPDEFKE